jgi:hypothetical protein
MLTVSLEDGRRVSVPIVWFPKLAEATDAQRRSWRLIGRGVGIHWPGLDEDISVENLLATRGELVAVRAPTRGVVVTTDTPGPDPASTAIGV